MSPPINKKRFSEIDDRQPPRRPYVTLEALLLAEISYRSKRTRRRMEFLMAMIRQDIEKGITKDWEVCRNNNATFKQLSTSEGGKYEIYRETILQII